jgi:hypothetical protein
VRYIISIQGGGLRGIIPCLALAKLEDQTGMLTRDWITKHDGLIAGTSTGALLAACVACGVPAADALKVYTEQGAKVFSPTNDAERKVRLVVTGHQFDNQVLASVVRNTLKSDPILNDLPIRVLITATATNKVPWYFVRDNPGNSQVIGKHKLADAAIASACATTYHEPWLIPSLGLFADGGCGGLCDPVYQAVVEAFYYDAFDPAETRIINLGTGYLPTDTQPKAPSNLLENISWVIDSLLGASKTYAEQIVDRHWPDLLTSYNPQLPYSIDEAEVNQIPTLLKIGQSAADKMDWSVFA